MSVASPSFRPTGLLGPLLKDTLPEDHNGASPGAGPSSPLDFMPTGLLSMSSSKDASNPSQSAHIVDEDCNMNDTPTEIQDETLSSLADLHRSLSSSPTNDASFSFKPNGLLGAISRPPQDEFDELPDPTSIFGRPTLLSMRSSENLPTTDPTLPPSSMIRAKTFNGRTVFISKKRQRFRKDTIESTQGLRNLLDLPIHRMLEQLSLDKCRQLRNIDSQATSSTTAGKPDEVLWVDRYRPTRFTELVGNERVARDILGWIKQWDYCVFGKRNMKGKKRALEDEEVNMDDEYRRPKEKILLLSGPPGLGKTTMAHVLAQQAGYEVLEVNASDDRDSKTVERRIQPALESGSALGATKPVLVVIDEIDGATGGSDESGGFISNLLALISGRQRKYNGKKKSQGKRPILRPIICICNDLYASSLTKLRPHAFQIRLQRPGDVHTVKRLKQVCESENLQADGRALSTLVAMARGDLRGCLNTLQFIKSRNEDVTESVVRKATSGMREGDTSILSVLNDLFSPLSKKRVKEMGLTDEEESKYVGRLSHSIDICGRDVSLAVGCFSHYANLRRHDADFSRYHKANEWLVTFDMFSTARFLEGEFALDYYLPYMLVPFYPLFQERGGLKVERNQTDWEVTQTTRANTEIYKSFGVCLRTASTRHGGDFRHLVSHPVLQLEIAPYINRIINPPLRPVNSQIIKPEERSVLRRLVSIMSALELRFVQERAEDGQLTYRLDPAVDVFITYDGKRAPDISLSRYAVRHLVAQEVETEIAARVDIIEKGKRGKHADMFGGSKKVQTESLNRSDKESGPAHKRAKIVELDIADKPPVDFFGRPITFKSVSKNSRSGNRTEKRFRIAYKYVEGNSAAVRKPVKVDAFI